MQEIESKISSRLDAILESNEIERKRIAYIISNEADNGVIHLFNDLKEKLKICQPFLNTYEYTRVFGDITFEYTQDLLSIKYLGNTCKITLHKSTYFDTKIGTYNNSKLVVNYYNAVSETRDLEPVKQQVFQFAVSNDVQPIWLDKELLPVSNNLIVESIIDNILTTIENKSNTTRKLSLIG